MDFLDYALAIIGFVLAYFFYRRSRRSKEPCWSVRNNVLVEGYSSKIGELDIRFNDERVENLSIARIAFWNQGAETLDRRDIETVNPLRIEVNEEIEILDISVSLTNSSSSQFETELAKDRKSAKLSFDYLDKGQGAIVQVIHTGIKKSDIQVVGDIKGVKKVSKKDILISNALLTAFLPVLSVPVSPNRENKKILSSTRRKITGAIYIITALIMLPLSGVVLYKNTSKDAFLGAGFLFLYGIVFILFAILFLRRGLPSGLEAFENEPLL